MKVLRGLLAVVVGYAVMVILITLVQETWFGGVGYYESSWGELGVAGFFTSLSAVAGAFVGTLVMGGASRVVATVMTLLVVTETTLLTIGGDLDGPLWFDVLAAGGLVVGIWIGAEAALRWSQRKPAEAAA